MQCSSCGTALQPGATTCPTCGMPTPYNVPAQGFQGSGSSPQDDPTVFAPPSGSSPQYGAPPHYDPAVAAPPSMEPRPGDREHPHPPMARNPTERHQRIPTKRHNTTLILLAMLMHLLRHHKLLTPRGLAGSSHNRVSRLDLEEIKQV